MKVTVFAAGYLAAIGAQNLGVGISDAGDMLQPTIDIDRYLLLGKRRTVSGNSTLTAGSNTMTSVPAGETWNIVLAWLELNTGGADTVTASCLAHTSPQGGGAGLLGLTGVISVPINSRGSLVFQPSGGFLAPAETQIHTRTLAVTGAPTYNWNLLVEVISNRS